MQYVILHWRNGSATTESLAHAKRIMLNSMVAAHVVFVEYWKR